MQLCYIIVARAAARIKRSRKWCNGRDGDFFKIVHFEFLHLTDCGGNNSLAISTFKSVEANILKVHPLAAFSIPGRQFYEHALFVRHVMHHLDWLVLVAMAENTPSVDFDSVFPVYFAV
jgi:hypothetical protein